MALRTYLTGIADAIREKKGTTDPINAQDFASEIASISTGGDGENPLQALVDGKGGTCDYLCAYYKGTTADFLSNIDFSQVTSMRYMFSSCNKLTTIPQLDTNKVTDMNNMFYACSNLITISALNTSNVTNMAYTFQGCSNLTSIPPLNTANVTSMNYTFSGCRKLVTIPQLDTNKVTDMGSMLSYLDNLETTPQINTNLVNNMTYMFSYCPKLTKIDITKLSNSNTRFAQQNFSLLKFIIRTMDTLPTYGNYMLQGCSHLEGKVNKTYNPEGLQDGRIYVPDDKVDALKAATGWSEFADVIVPLSTLVED